jgi:hypothetical protein
MKLIRQIVFLGIISLPGCGSTNWPPQPPQTKVANSPPQERTQDTGAWYIQDPTISPIDGAKTQFVSRGPLGSRLVLCFENGQLCGGRNIAVFVTSPCWVDGGEEEDTRYKRRVRLRFDSDAFLVQTWGISEDHRGIFPYSPKDFISNLKKHESLAFEFGCNRSDSDVVTFDIHNLQAAMDSVDTSLTKEVADRNLKNKQENEALQQHIRTSFTADVANVKAGYKSNYVYDHCVINHSDNHLVISASDGVVCEYISDHDSN